MSSCFIRLTILLALLSWGLVCPGQDPEGRQGFRTYGVAEGLENLAVQAVAQDGEGFIWVGTEGNLFRYDGTRFRAFGMKEGLPSGDITALHPGTHGEMWVGTWKGLVRVRRGRVETFGPAQGLPAIRIDEVGEGAGDVIWAGTDLGPYISRDGERFEAVAGWTGGEASALCPLPTGGAWVAAGPQLRFADREGRWTVYGREVGLVGSERIDSVVQDRRGRVWVRSAHGLWMRPVGGTRFEDHSRHLPGYDKDEGNLYLDRHDRLWVPTEQGLAVLEGEKWSRLGSRQGLPCTRPLDVMLDREGTLWVGGQGLHRSLGQGVWRSYAIPEGLPHDTIWTIRRDEAGALWVGTDGGLSKGTAAGWEHIPGTEAFGIRWVLRGPDGRLWMGGSSPQLLIWDEKARRMSRLGTESGLRGRRLLRLLFDREGVPWVATDGAGLLKGVREGDRWRFQREALPEGTPEERVSHLLEDRWGRLWACGIYGLLCRDGGAWRRYTVKDGLRFTHVSYLIQRRDGTFHGAYFDPQGTFSLEAAPGVFKVTGHLGVKEGLASDKIYLLGEDARNRLWVGTGRGVDLVEGGKVAHYGSAEGMPGEDCDAMAFLAEPGGGVWVGTSTGLGHYVGGSDKARPDPPVTALAEATLGELPLDPHEPGPPPDPSRRTLTVRYSALSYLNETRMEYQVTLSGLEAGWVDTTQREARYPLLRPGAYVFKVRSRHPGGEWGPEAGFRFEVNPAWWQTTLARVLALLSLGALGVLAYRWRVKVLQKRNQILASLVARRTEELTTANTQLLAAKEDMERASQYKSEFLASMSHELRTPLNAILLYSELLMEDAEDAGNAEATEDLRRIRNSGQHLLGLINGVLDLSKIEAGRMTLYAEDVGLPVFLEDLKSTLHALVAAKGNRLEIQLEPGFLQLRADATKLRQILYNLVSNACKFTEKGVITVEASLEGREARFVVRDTGIGMTPEQLGRIFQEFVQAEAHTAHRYGGTGLGLTISRKLVELMGGRIVVESEPGRGTAFTFHLPAEGAEGLVRIPVAPPPGPVPEAPQPKVLIIDDDPSMRDYLARSLGKHGYWVATAGGGEEGIQLARTLQPHLITLDVVMEGMDGWDVLAALQEDPLLNGIPVVLLSMMDGRERGYALGAKEVLQKPVSGEMLAQVLAKWQRGGTPHVLVVEDDEDTRSAMKAMLERQGWAVCAAADSGEAFACLEKETPTLVLLDLLLPGMDGFAFADRCSLHGKWKEIPIVVLTSKDLSSEEVARLQASGVDKILRKGAHSKQELLEIVEGLVETTLKRK